MFRFASVANVCPLHLSMQRHQVYAIVVMGYDLP
jgi:hypothetical protein